MFIIVIVSFSSVITITVNVLERSDGRFDIAFEKSYYLSYEFIRDSEQIQFNLTQLVNEYNSEENILNGGTINLDELDRNKDRLFEDFKQNSKSYNPNVTDGENYEKFEEVYTDKISQIKNELIEEDIRKYKAILRILKEFHDVIYYGSDGENVFTNRPNITKDDIKAYPSYIIITNKEQIVYPDEIKENRRYDWLSFYNNQVEQQDDVMYIAYTEEYLNSSIEEWQRNKVIVTNSLYKITGLFIGFILAFIYLIFVIGRKNFGDKEIYINFVDSIYNDIKVLISLALIMTWFASMVGLHDINLYWAMFPITLFIATLGLIIVLSLIKQMKYKTLMKHTLIYRLLKKIVVFFKELYVSGSIGFKVVSIVIGYPIIVVLFYYLSPLVIGIGVWLAMKKLKEYKAIQEGIEKVKEGDFHHKINVSGDGELAKLAKEMNTITDGLNKAIANELKSVRLKTELITNVSHDIRTPLTSIITYVDLLKKEEDQGKVKEYIDIIEQKSQRLKILTDDLFEAAKASSGDIPVNLEQIELISLITQGLGELDDKVQEAKLDFKINHSTDKVFIQADGKLLWRAMENLLSNIFKYALQGSRVYINIEETENQVILVIKNISAYELNISSDELMERFKRGDEARSSQGSGLGLSITKNLIEIQKGSFHIEIDGDLFKVIINIPK